MWFYVVFMVLVRMDVFVCCIVCVRLYAWIVCSLCCDFAVWWSLYLMIVGC